MKRDTHYRFTVNAAQDAAELMIFDDIGESWFGGITAKQVAADLKAAGKVKQITCRINSQGGDVFDAFAIYKVSDNAIGFVENRSVEHYCQGGFGDEDKREAILRALADCRAVFLARVGDGPAKRLRDAGIEPVTDYPYGAPEASITSWLTTA